MFPLKFGEQRISLAPARGGRLIRTGVTLCSVKRHYSTSLRREMDLASHPHGSITRSFFGLSILPVT